MGLGHRKPACEHWVYFQEQLESDGKTLIPTGKVEAWCEAL